MLNYVQLSANLAGTVHEMVETRVPPSNPRRYPYPKYQGYDWWMDRYINWYDLDANNGEFSAPYCQMVHLPELLRFLNTDCTQMARKITDYWVAQVTPAGGAISVTNDAEKIFVPISNYMCSYASRPNELHLPIYEHLFQYVETQVKTIVWTATLSNLSTVDFSILGTDQNLDNPRLSKI